ncbi:glycosyltransferase family 2 protein [Halomonas sp. 328]|uniref:glycosyltransferase family 2 protein n=1 Tax=Halomonas sp. 328 TaxID=2776704 RepID=UPI0018A79003|nr:glycosyltransferase family A protein [Halomonas sp. 328]MBF8224473.1 glycosyltransferase family 2 protein [Halomonas sp. 328]
MDENKIIEFHPKVSVVCAWYNRADYICDTIDSLLAQDFDSFEVIVINDGSSDPRVREILNSYSDARLRVVHQENAGLTTTLVRAVNLSRAPFVAIQGAGDISYPTRLKKQFEAFERHPEIAIVGCYYDVVDLNGGSKKKVTLTAPPVGALRKMRFSHGELMYRKEVYDNVGGYREIFDVGQGSDLWMRMLRKNRAFVVCSPLYQQRVFEDGVSNNYSKLAARSIMSAVRVENEKIYRKCGVDYIEQFGLASVAILSSRFRVKLQVAMAQSYLMLNKKTSGFHGLETGFVVKFLMGLIYFYRIFSRAKHKGGAR